MFDVKHLLSVEYRIGGRTPETGFDCFGLVRYLRKRLGLTAPDAPIYDVSKASGAVREIDRQSSRFIWVDPPTLGDIVLMRVDRARHWHHVGIFLEPHNVIHAHQRSRRVILTPVNRLNEEYAEWKYVRLD